MRIPKQFFLKRNLRLSMIITLLVIFLFSSTYAQETESPKKISDLGLPILNGAVKVYYSMDYTKRAAYLQEILEDASHFLGKKEILGVELELGLAVLDEKDWARWTRMPYGMAHIQLGESPAAILPATEDNMLVNGALENKDKVSEGIIKSLEEIGFSYEEAVLVVFMDLLGIHEVGHIYSKAYETWPTEKWLSEFIATYLAYAFFKEYRPKCAKLWDTMMDSMVETNEHSHTTLADFEEFYVRVGGSNYGWYQAKFAQKVCEVYAKSGISFMHTLKKSLAENPGAAEGDPFRLRELDNFSEGFTKWAVGPTGNLK